MLGAGGNGLVARVEGRDRQTGGNPARLQTTAQLDTGSARDEELDHGELRREVLVLFRRVVEIEGDGDVVALGVQEVLRELRCIRITLGQQNQKTRL